MILPRNGIIAIGFEVISYIPPPNRKMDRPVNETAMIMVGTLNFSNVLYILRLI